MQGQVNDYFKATNDQDDICTVITVCDKFDWSTAPGGPWVTPEYFWYCQLVRPTPNCSCTGIILTPYVTWYCSLPRGPAGPQLSVVAAQQRPWRQQAVSFELGGHRLLL